MDANHFDALTRSLTDAPSRRRVLHGLGAVTIALIGARLPGAVLAGKKHKKKRRNKNGCKRGTEACQGQCVPRCAATEVRNPATCGCCGVTGTACGPTGPSATCCSAMCGIPSGLTGSRSATVRRKLEAGACAGLAVGDACAFSAQCETGFCSPAGLCLFAAP